MKIAIISLGCPKNQTDADVFCRALLEAGHETVADVAEADVAIVNTCGFIQSAKEEAIAQILDACGAREVNPALKVVVTGCLAERYREQVAEEMPEVDAVVGIGSNASLPEIVAQLCGRQTTGGPALESYGDKRQLPLSARRVISTPGHYAWLKIAEGCSNACSYCAIPAIRGPLRSRPLAECVAEARWLAEQGVRELVLVAQDVTAYGDDLDDPGANIVALLRALEGVEGFVWIRLLYAYPERITAELVETVAACSKVLPYFDIPIQHISDEILASMRRRGNASDIRRALSLIREGLPAATLRTTLIVGYPGETEEQFSELCAFVKETQFDRLGCFAYSPEEGTAAAALPGQLPEDEKERRVDVVMQLQGRIMAEKQERRIGEATCVVCDGFDEEEGLWVCRTAADAPEIDGRVLVESRTPLAPGQFLRVRITGADMYDLFATPEE